MPVSYNILPVNSISFSPRSKRNWLVLCLVIFTLWPVIATAQATGSNVIPKPVSMAVNRQKFKINAATVILADAYTHKITSLLRDNIKAQTGYDLSVGSNAIKNFIRLKIDSNLVKESEGYLLNAGKNNLHITAHDAAGMFYALQTLTQLIQPAGGEFIIEGCTIKDYPRFAYRGMHLDVSRHMFPVDAIKKWINVLAFYKINTFQWHLTDDQGWRIEIKKYPLLQSVAAYREATLIGHKRELPHRFDGVKYGGYYTRDEVKAVVAYAAERHITVVPEIEMPGHAMAALAAYPALGCTGGPYKTATYWGVFDDVFCAGNEETFTFLQDVLDEVLEMFPSRYIHIGGDECPKVRWQQCPKCRQRIKQENLKNEAELQGYFMKRMENYLTQKHRKVIGWDEILEGGVGNDATIMSWTGTKGGVAAAKMHHNAIMTPEAFVYLDYYQSLHKGEPLAAGGYTPLYKVYNYEPVPGSLNAEESRYITGVQANVWSEYISGISKAEYMMFPRIIALAEVGWSAKSRRNYTDFLKRLRSHYPLLKQMNLAASNNFDEIRDTLILPAKGNPMLYLTSTLPGAQIRYTANGTLPDAKSLLYKNGIRITGNKGINARVYISGKPRGRIFTKEIVLHKAINRPVQVSTKPISRFDPGNINILVNGIAGNRTYNDGQWLGFTDTTVAITIDLGSVTTVSSIGTNILKYHWQKMWEPVSLKFLISADGKQYQEAYSQQSFPVNGINHIQAKVQGKQARFIKMLVKNRKTIPDGEYGTGGVPVFLTDEVIVH